VRGECLFTRLIFLNAGVELIVLIVISASIIKVLPRVDIFFSNSNFPGLDNRFDLCQAGKVKNYKIAFLGDALTIYKLAGKQV
jgi:hypothetical protein